MLHARKALTLTLPLFAFALAGCAQPTSPRPASAHSGDYVSADYANRAAGYDWLAVSLSETQADQIAVSVRARSDRKKPTCTFDGYAQKTGAHTYAFTVQGQPITLTLTPERLSIAADRPEGAAALAYFCSGGATLAGSYDKVSGQLDRRQLDPRPFTPGA